MNREILKTDEPPPSKLANGFFFWNNESCWLNDTFNTSILFSINYQKIIPYIFVEGKNKNQTVWRESNEASPGQMERQSSYDGRQYIQEEDARNKLRIDQKEDGGRG